MACGFGSMPEAKERRISNGRVLSYITTDIWGHELIVRGQHALKYSPSSLLMGATVVVRAKQVAHQ